MKPPIPLSAHIVLFLFLVAAAIMLSSCAGYTTSVGVFYESAEGRKVGANATFQPTGKQTVRPQK